jgi:hypothetical protein
LAAVTAPSQPLMLLAWSELAGQVLQLMCAFELHVEHFSA